MMLLAGVAILVSGLPLHTLRVQSRAAGRWVGVQPLFAGHQYGVGGIYDIIGVYDAPLYEQAVMNACS